VSRKVELREKERFVIDVVRGLSWRSINNKMEGKGITAVNVT
jgi:hypothetical protein